MRSSLQSTCISVDRSEFERRSNRAWSAAEGIFPIIYRDDRRPMHGEGRLGTRLTRQGTPSSSLGSSTGLNPGRERIVGCAVKNTHLCLGLTSDAQGGRTEAKMEWLFCAWSSLRLQLMYINVTLWGALGTVEQSRL